MSEKGAIGAIDILCNLFTPEGIKRAFWTHEESLKLMKWWHMEDRVKGVPVEEFIKVLDEAGVDKVLIPALMMRSYKKKDMMVDYSNEDIYKVTKKVPDRLIGLAGINPLQGMNGVRELERAIKEFGMKGAYLHTYGFGFPLNDRRYYPFYAKCAELGIPVMMQVGHSAEFMPSALGKPIYLDDIALDFPELTIVGAHTGWPWVEEMIALAWKHPNVHLGCDAHAPRYWPPSLLGFIKKP
jgi:hypothetical protein